MLDLTTNFIVLNELPEIHAPKRKNILQFDIRDFLPILKPKMSNVDKYKNTTVLIPEAIGYKAYTLFVDKWVCIYEVVAEEEVEAQDDK